MIRSITLHNFKSHRDNRLIFSPGVNAIIGEGMAGKSNIIRAFNMVRIYRPITNKFRSYFAKDPKDFTSIVIRTEEGGSVKLIKGRPPTYIVRKPNGEKLKFAKFGVTVPFEVDSVLRLKNINIQSQLDKPYIVSLSPGQVTRIINSATRVSVADKWLKDLNQVVRTYTHLMSENHDEQKQTKKEIRKLRKLDQVEPIVNKIYDKEIEIKRIEQRMVAIEGALADIETAARKIKKYEKQLRAEKTIKRARAFERRIKNLKPHIQSISELISSMKKIDTLQEEYSERSIQLAEALRREKICPTCMSKITREQIAKIKSVEL